MAVQQLKAIDINGSLAATANVSTDETDLASTILAASSMSEIGSAIHVTAWGTVANNANAKTVTFYFGTDSQAFSLQASVATAWRLDCWVLTSAANTQKGVAHMSHGVLAANTNDVFVIAATETASNPITVKVTGTGGASNDILCNGFVIQT